MADESEDRPPIEPSCRFEAITVDKGPGLWGRIAKAIPGLSWNDTEPAHLSENRRD
jgi:hypothetical protein